MNSGRSRGTGQSQPLVIAVDLGGTRIRVALSDLQGHFLHRIERATGAEEGREAVLDRLVDSIQQARQAAPSEGACIGVGLGSPGPLDPRTGVILSAPNLPGWENVPLQEIMEDRLGMPARLANDGNAAVLGEWAFGAGRGHQNLIYVTISTGVGGGIIADGRLVLGRRGLAGEVGHMTLQADGPRCNCGNTGCWEALASGTAIARQGAAAVLESRSPLLAELSQGVAGRVDAKLVGEAARRGDPVAGEIIQQAALYSGIGIASLIHLFSPEVVLVGGGVSKLGDFFLEPVRHIVHERVMAPYKDTPVKPAALGGDVGLLGAVALFLPEEE